MSIDIKLDDSGDIDFSGYEFSSVSGSEQVAQNLKIRLKFFLGEWFLNKNLGLPYYENVLKKNTDPGNITSIFKAHILETKEVDRLTSFDLSDDGRELIIDFSVESNSDIINIGTGL